ncbi:flavodoxin domain-containing protein [Niallia sp. XMNu-256]|uniref:flavodoxin domain-containing protein n=1 Tax=Niallia sp. XMNu-256 TaxID=3082444 RepID=UPI0030D2B489
MKIAIVYASQTGNTEELVHILYKLFRKHGVNVEVYKINEFPLDTLPDYDGIIVGTYTWGDGEIPTEMASLYQAFENQDVSHVTTGIIGTGDRFYAHFCGAVDRFRDMLYVHTQLAVTLKVELSPQTSDNDKCHRFVELFFKRCESSFGSLNIDSALLNRVKPCYK